MTTRLSFPSLMKEWGCPLLTSTGLSSSSPFLIQIRVQRSCSIVTKALVICAYLETRNVAKWRANRSGLRIWGETFAKSERGFINDQGMRDSEWESERDGERIWTYSMWCSWLEKPLGQCHIYTSWTWRIVLTRIGSNNNTVIWFRITIIWRNVTFISLYIQPKIMSKPYLVAISPSNNASTLYSTMWCHLSSLTTRKTRTLDLP